MRKALTANVGKRVLIDVDEGNRPFAEAYTAVAIPVTVNEQNLHYAYNDRNKGAFLEKVALRHVKLVRPFPTKKEE